MNTTRNYTDDDDLDFDEDDEYDLYAEERWVCLFPGECCMPGEHSSDECHTAEMAAEQWDREQGGTA